MASNLEEAPAITAGVSNLRLQSATKGQGKASDRKGKRSGKQKAVTNNWDDDSVSSNSDGETESSRAATLHRDGTAAPPPTPVTPNHNLARGFASATSPSNLEGTEDSDVRRPEKTDAVARRMISAGLGLKAPKLTEEQKAYEKAVKEKERKRREQEKAAERRKEEEALKAKAAIWED
jgi:hypothetical protein